MLFRVAATKSIHNVAIPVHCSRGLLISTRAHATSQGLGLATTMALQEGGRWRKLGCAPEELQLQFTLPTGQSFRWWPAGRGDDPSSYVGVLGKSVVAMRQAPAGEGGAVEYATWGPGADGGDGDAAELAEYFNLSGAGRGVVCPPLTEMYKGFAEADPHFAAIRPYFPGARVMRQDPLECLLSFICSSNNHISRIHGMVDRLCAGYGTPLGPLPSEVAWEGEEEIKGLAPSTLHAFPTLEQLAAADEQALRDAGFGYRAKFITGTVAMLRDKPEGGDNWLLGLREVPYKEASAALCTLPGVGPKVCLFALDKHDAVPVDTHVWQATTRLYMPELEGKTLTPKVMVAVEEAWVSKFGPLCGWAHNTIFLSELSRHRALLPSHLQPPPPAPKAKKTKKPKADMKRSKAAADGGEGVEGAEGGEGVVAGGGEAGKRKKRGGETLTAAAAAAAIDSLLDDAVEARVVEVKAEGAGDGDVLAPSATPPGKEAAAGAGAGGRGRGAGGAKRRLEADV